MYKIKIVGGGPPGGERGFAVLIKLTKKESHDPFHRNSLTCTGSLINSRFVLTAGHCVCDWFLGLYCKEFITGVKTQYRVSKRIHPFFFVNKKSLDNISKHQKHYKKKAVKVYFPPGLALEGNAGHCSD